MIKIFGMGLAAACISLIGLTPAGAANVARVSGEILVNDGSGFVQLATEVELAPGSQLMVRPGGVAIISYADTCAIRVDSGRLWTVQEHPPCAEGHETVDFTGRMNGGSLKDDPILEEPVDRTPLLAAGLVAGGATAIILTDDNPSSP